MKFVFCLYEYFPFGGLQRDFLKITEKAMQRGHSVKILTMDWQGEQPPGLDVHLLPHSAISNHRRCLKFTKTIVSMLPDIQSDVVVGFNKMPGLDVYYAADSCYLARMRKTRPLASRLMGRYSTYAGFEEAVFSPESNTEILSISPQEQLKFIELYGTQEDRFHLLPPGISKDRFRPDNAECIRSAVRSEFDVSEDQLMLLMVGSAFQTKGVDRAIRAINSLPDSMKDRVRLFVLGKGKIRSFSAFAKRMNLGNQVHFLGGRDDVHRFLLASDLLIHPARTENTGTALIEAMVAGLPVIVTDNCGYAFHVKKAGAGKVVQTPFDQELLNNSLKQILSEQNLPELGARGIAYGKQVDVIGLHDKAVDVIEDVARRKAPQ